MHEDATTYVLSPSQTCPTRLKQAQARQVFMQAVSEFDESQSLQITIVRARRGMSGSHTHSAFFIDAGFVTGWEFAYAGALVTFFGTSGPRCGSRL